MNGNKGNTGVIDFGNIKLKEPNLLFVFEYLFPFCFI